MGINHCVIMKNVLVTGAASGIGYNLTNYLANRSYNVYAGVRKQEDLKLFSHDFIHPILLDDPEKYTFSHTSPRQSLYQCIFRRNQSAIAGTTPEKPIITY